MSGGVTNTASVTVSNAMVLLATAKLAGAAASIDFSGIPSGYSHFHLRFCGDTAAAGTLAARFNADAGNNYYHNQILANNTTVSGGAVGPVSYAMICLLAGDKQGSGVVDISNFLAAEALAKQWVSNAGGFYMNRVVAGWWNNTAAEINQITLFEAAGANLKAGFTASLYGVTTV